MTEQVTLKGPEGTLAAVFDDAGSTTGSVITHPHPLYGGNMENNVVHCAASACCEAGLSVLRFNFRGVGQSSGTYDDGDGEQDDLAAAVTFLTGNGCRKVLVVGYSFGAWVAAMAADKGRIEADLVLIAPPVAFVSHESISALPGLRGVVTGELDRDIAPISSIHTHLKRWHPGITADVLPGADHFFSGCEQALSEWLRPVVRDWNQVALSDPL
ncbi:MAG: alpha/beta hydrolase [Deltaproteobacteria bacterium]|nr:MAG: alpha/beta hydrolase [Deltaproteobacteria bacterium]